MNGERRNAGVPRIERRRSARWLTNETLTWHVSRGRRARAGRIVERSLDGFALLVTPKDEPAEGTRFSPSDPEDCVRFGFCSAVVTRTESVGESAKLVFAEIEA